MRATLRWLACIIPVTLLLLLIHDHYRPANAITKLLPYGSAPQNHTFTDELKLGHTNSTETVPYTGLTAHPKSIEQFWRKWYKILYDARPKIGEVRQDGVASTLSPSNNDEPRKPYANVLRLSQSDTKSLQESHAQFVQELANIGNDRDIFGGQGVVMVGGGEYFGPAIISIQMLRRSGNTLPVEIFVPNQDEYEKELCEQYLPKLNSRCVVLSTILAQVDNEGTSLDISHYQFKALALLLSSFSEVLLLDSDSIPITDPTTMLFNTAPFTTSNLIIWPDFWASTENPSFWTIAGQPSFPENLPATASETGQLLVNKSTHLPTLLLATYYNIFGPSHYYPLLSQGALGQGDKETFMAAAVALNQTYYRVKTPVSAVGRHTGEEHKGTAMIQYLPSDDLAKFESELKSTVRPAFVHANTPKMNAGHLIDEGDLFSYDGKKRLRLLGSKEDQLKLFGFDFEKSVWELLVQTGCELADVVGEWRGRERMCERLEEHYVAMFDRGRDSWWRGGVGGGG